MGAMIRTETRSVGSRTFTWRDAGPPSSPNVLVWLHAFPLSGEMWTAQMDVTGWRTIAPDLAGLGGTSDHTDTPAIEDFARDTATLLDYLRVGTVVVGGLSMGGYAALAFQHLYADRLRGLILSDTRSAADSPAARIARETMLGIVESKGAAGVADEMMPKLVGATTHRSRPEVIQRVRALIGRNSPSGIGRAVRRLRDRPDRTSEIGTIAVPTLVVVGEEDALTPVDDSRALAAGIPDATLVILPGAGHLSNLETPDAFSGAIRPWLAGIA
jgi:pimeloyl-ACP methyl ester carboxylesterase